MEARTGEEMEVRENIRQRQRREREDELIFLLQQLYIEKNATSFLFEQGICSISRRASLI